MDWNVYSQQPNFTSGQAGRVKRLKQLRAHQDQHSASFNASVKKKLGSLFGSRRSARTQYNTTPLYGDGTYTGQQMDQQVISAVRGKYGGAVTDLESQIAGAPQRQAQISKYYDDYAKALGDLRTQQAQQAQAMIDQQSKNSKSTQAAEQSANTATAQALSSDAASRGQSADTSQFTKANQASAARATTSNTQQAQLMASKNAYDNFYGQQGLINMGAKNSALGLEGKNTQTLRDKLLGLRQDAGDFATTTRGALDEAQFQRKLSVGALGLKGSAQAFDQKIAAGKLQNDQDKLAWSMSPDNPKNKPKSGKSGGPTGTQVRSGRKQWRELANYLDSNYPNANQYTAKQLGDTLRNGYTDNAGKKFKGQTTDSFLAFAAATRKRYGGVTKYQAKVLKRDYGLSVPVSKSAQKAAHPKG